MSKNSSEVPQLDVPSFSEFELGKRTAQVLATGILADLARRIYWDVLIGKKTDYSELPRDLSADLSELSQCCMKLKVKTHGNFPKLGEKERGIVISNHPSDITLWPWADVIAQTLTPKLKAVAKKEVMYEIKNMPPIFGWLGKLTELLILIDRSDREASVKSIREACETIFVPGTAAVIFPDGHRPTKDSIERSHVEMTPKLVKKYPNPDLSELMPYTCVSKSGGLLALLRGTAGAPVRILNTTVGLSVAENGPDTLGSTIHILGKEVDIDSLLGPSSDPEKQEENLQQWLFFNDIKRNAHIESWREA